MQLGSTFNADAGGVGGVIAAASNAFPAFAMFFARSNHDSRQ
jgi:hypothetical protein